MGSLPSTKMYALRHGVSRQIWRMTDAGRWLWPSVDAMKRSWENMQECRLVTGPFEEHVVVEIGLREL